jgi:cytochrome P450
VVDEMVASLDMPDSFREYVYGMTLVDGKAHNRLRRLVLPAFSVRRIKAMRPRLERISDELIEALAAKGTGDLLEDYSAPLTGMVICELIGIDVPDQPKMRQWMHDFTAGDYADSAEGMVNCSKELIKRRRAEPKEDLISTMITTSDQAEDGLSEAEMIGLILLLVNAGHQSTAHFIPNAVLALFDHPDQLARLRAEPEMMPTAIDELMRIGNPLPFATPRYAIEDLEFAGMPIRKGEALTASFQAANYDPDYFDDPDRFHIDRDMPRGHSHLSFGAGPHYCLGAALARLEGTIALDHLLLQRDTLELAVPRDEIGYADVNLGLRLLAGLPVKI